LYLPRVGEFAKLPYPSRGVYMPNESDTTGTAIYITNTAVPYPVLSYSHYMCRDALEIQEANILWQQEVLNKKNQKYKRWLDRQAIPARKHRQMLRAKKMEDKRVLPTRKGRHAKHRNRRAR
jgi:hypothetical protein